MDSFFVKAVSGVMRQETVRVARPVRESEETEMVLGPLASHGSVRGECWKMLEIFRPSNPALPGFCDCIAIRRK